MTIAFKSSILGGLCGVAALAYMTCGAAAGPVGLPGAQAAVDPAPFFQQVAYGRKCHIDRRCKWVWVKVRRCYNVKHCVNTPYCPPIHPRPKYGY